MKTLLYTVISLFVIGCGAEEKTSHLSKEIGEEIALNIVGEWKSECLNQDGSYFTNEFEITEDYIKQSTFLYDDEECLGEIKDRSFNYYLSYTINGNKIDLHRYDGEWVYNIIKIENEKMQIGDKETGDGTTVLTRPKTYQNILYSR